MNNNTVTLKINGEDIVISKLPLRKISEVFKALENLPKTFTDKFEGQDLTAISNDQIVTLLPDIIADALPEVAKLIAVATPLKEDQVLDELGLSDAVEVLVAIFEVNDFSKVVDNIKKLVARKPLNVKTK